MRHPVDHNIEHLCFRCEGVCRNVLVCSLSGGVVVHQERGACPGLLSVCCRVRRLRRHRARAVESSHQFVRIPRQSSNTSVSHHQRPRQARYVPIDAGDYDGFKPIINKQKHQKLRRPQKEESAESNEIFQGYGECGKSRQISERRILGK